MKTLLSLGLCLLLIGCGPLVVKTEVVTVKVPVAYIPPPPNVPKIKYKVDRLTPQDKQRPGVVGQAYVYDLAQARAMIEIYSTILDQYKNSSVHFDEVNKKIEELYK